MLGRRVLPAAAVDVPARDRGAGVRQVEIVATNAVLAVGSLGAKPASGDPRAAVVDGESEQVSAQ